MKKVPSTIICENCDFRMNTSGLPMMWPDEDTPSDEIHNKGEKDREEYSYLCNNYDCGHFNLNRNR